MCVELPIMSFNLMRRVTMLPFESNALNSNIFSRKSLAAAVSSPFGPTSEALRSMSSMYLSALTYGQGWGRVRVRVTRSQPKDKFWEGLGLELGLGLDLGPGFGEG